MATHNIQIRKKNGSSWDILYPVTLATNVNASTGHTVQHELDHMFDKTATPSSNGSLSAADKKKLDEIEAGANKYIHPNTANMRHVTDAQMAVWNDKYTRNEIDTKFNELSIGLDWKESVDTYEDIATTYPNPQDGWTVNTKNTDITYRYTGTTWIQISANSIPVASQSVDGKMSKEDKRILDNLNISVSNMQQDMSNLNQGVTGDFSDITNKLNDTQKQVDSNLSKISGLEANKSDVNHNHDGEYADYIHTHTEYAKTAHSHGDIYAEKNHTHTGYANSSHNHDSVYAKIGHTHSEDFINATGGTMTGKLSFKGSTMTSVINCNREAGRQELQIYASGDSFMENSRGAGIHLYGNNDIEHDGNIAFMTGPDDKGTARMIISERGNVTIGGAILDFVDEQNDKGLVNIVNPVNKPALYILQASSSEGEMAVPAGDRLDLGHYDGTTFTPRLGVLGNGNSYVANKLQVTSGIILNNTRDLETRGIEGYMGSSDRWRVVGGTTAVDAGYLEIATCYNGNEPVYVRQYLSSGGGDVWDSTKIARTLTLLDASGNTTLPGLLTTGNKITIKNGNALGTLQQGTAYLDIKSTGTTGIRFLSTPYVSGTSDYKIYHEGNKPTASAIGALPTTGGEVTSGHITFTSDNTEQRVMFTNCGATKSSCYLYKGNPANGSTTKLGVYDRDNSVPVWRWGTNDNLYLSKPTIIDKIVTITEMAISGVNPGNNPYAYGRLTRGKSDNTGSAKWQFSSISKKDGKESFEVISKDWQAIFKAADNGHVYAYNDFYCDNVKRNDGNKYIYSNDSKIVSLSIGNVNGDYLHVDTNGFGAKGVDWWTSDIKLKHNIKDLSPKEKEITISTPALDIVNKLKHYSFIYNESNEHVQCGYIAQQLEEVNENFVSKVLQPENSPYYNEEDPYIRQPIAGKIIPYLSKAIQEQNLLIRDLQEQIKELKAKIN